MPRGGRRKGAGRKPLRRGQRRLAVLTRLAPQLRRKLMRAAQRNGRSLSREIEMRLTLTADREVAADVTYRLKEQDGAAAAPVKLASYRG